MQHRLGDTLLSGVCHASADPGKPRAHLEVERERLLMVLAHDRVAHALPLAEIEPLVGAVGCRRGQSAKVHDCRRGGVRQLLLPHARGAAFVLRFAFL